MPNHDVPGHCRLAAERGAGPGPNDVVGHLLSS